MKIEIEISDEDAASIRALCEGLESPHGSSHGCLTPETLLGMLAEDCALAVRRPGSWEGANMLDVLASHGYRV